MIHGEKESKPARSAVKPGDFPLGSMQSRAAARAMFHPLRSIEEEYSIAVGKTLSNEELDTLIKYVETLQGGAEYVCTPEQQAVLSTFSGRIDELKTTGKLTAEPWGWMWRYE
jgi:hypothetical protein